MSVISGTIGAVLGAQAQSQATRAQAQQAQEQNQLLRDLFAQSRGSTGHAILPEYFGPEERRAGEYATSVFDATKDLYGTPADVAARGKAIADRYRPLLESGSRAVEGLYSGELLNKELAAASPVAAARLRQAGTVRQGLLSGIQQRLQAINAQRAGQGFTGSGSAADNAALRAQILGNQQAAGAQSAAELQNAEDERQIRQQILDLQLRSPEVAGALARQATGLETLPAELSGAITRSTLSPLDWFKINVGTPPQQTMAPWAQPNPGVWQILANQTGQLGQQVGSYYLNRDIANRYAARNSYVPTSTTANYTGQYPEGYPTTAADWDSVGY